MTDTMEWVRGVQVYHMITTTAGQPADNGARGGSPRGGVDVAVPVEVDGWELYIGGEATGLHVADYDPLLQSERGGRAGAWGAPGWGVVCLWGMRLDCGLGGTREEAVESGRQRAMAWWPMISERLPWREGRDATLKAAQAVGAAAWSW